MLITIKTQVCYILICLIRYIFKLIVNFLWKWKIIKSINVLKTLNHVKWDTECNNLINLYRSLVRSKLDYESINYINANLNILKTIDIIHNSSLRVLTKAFRSYPIPSILFISKYLPFSIKLYLNYILVSYSSQKSRNNHF